MGIWLIFLIPIVLAVEHQPERILDVRQVIKDALDIMRSYPAPTSMMQQSVQQTQVQQQQQPRANYYAQQHQSYYPRAHGSKTYNGGAVSQVDQRYGQKADGQPQDYASQMSRWFATPTRQDMDKLFHLPADIMHRLASDAGYIQPTEEALISEPSSYKRYLYLKNI